MTFLRVALLHLAPIAGAVAHNRRLVEMAVERAASAGAEWIVTPELVISGYTFAKQIGTDWILPHDDEWLQGFCARVRELRGTMFLGQPERDGVTGRLHNSVVVIAPNGEIIRRQHKRNTLSIGAQSWSSSGDQSKPIAVTTDLQVGILICADAYPPNFAAELHEQGAQFLISCAAWAQGMHGPEGEWEARTRETGLPLFVCNRTGIDPTLDFTNAKSAVVYGGECLKTFHAPDSAIFVFDWGVTNKVLANVLEPIYLEEQTKRMIA